MKWKSKASFDGFLKFLSR